MTINQDKDPQQKSEQFRESLRLIIKSIPAKINAQLTLDQYFNFGFRPDHASLEDKIIGESCTIYLQARELFRLTK